MAIPRITYDNKSDRRSLSGARINKVVADDMNQLKASVNSIIDALANLRQRIVLNITSASFTGGYYDATDTIGLTPDVDFNIRTGEGSGTFVYNADGGYAFNSVTGRITMAPGTYCITIFKPLA